MIIIFATLITGVILFFMDFALFYNIKSDDEGGSYTNIYNKVNSSMQRYAQVGGTLEIEEQMGNKLSNMTTTETDAGDNIYANVGAAVSLGWQSFGLAKEMLFAIAYDLGIPNFIVVAVVAIILITLISAVIYALFKRLT